MDNKTLIQSYMDGWKMGDQAKILTSLSANCVIVESHGPTYRGIEIIKKWIIEWTRSNKIENWDLTSFYSFDNMICCEWDFSYIGKETKEKFSGITIAQIDHGKIAWLKEYRMTAAPYEWHLAT